MLEELLMANLGVRLKLERKRELCAMGAETKRTQIEKNDTVRNALL